MKVSVCITTYNHRQFIAQALDSVLSQQADFDFEILVGEDDSSDGTRQIVERYAAEHPDRIRLFLHDRKNVLYIDGRPTGRRNFVNNIEHARGEYIALLDGDDYWTDPNKLQKQVDFLAAHPETAICFHAVRCEDMLDPSNSYEQRPPGRKQFYDLQDLLAENIVPSCATMFRRGLFGAFPDWYFRIAIGDWPLHVLNAQHGNIGYLDEVLAGYRVHGGGAWNGRPLTNRLQTVIELSQDVAVHLDSGARKVLEKKVFVVSLRLAEEFLKLGSQCQARDLITLPGFFQALRYGCPKKYMDLFLRARRPK